jgi:hypothetical protein
METRDRALFRYHCPDPLIAISVSQALEACFAAKLREPCQGLKESLLSDVFTFRVMSHNPYNTRRGTHVRPKQVVKSITPPSHHLLDQKSLIFTRSDPY